MKIWMWLGIIVVVGVTSWIVASNIMRDKIDLMHGSGGMGYAARGAGGIWNCIDKDGNSYKSRSPCPKVAKS